MNAKGRLLLILMIALCILNMVLFSGFRYEQSACFNPFDYPVSTNAYIRAANKAVPILLDDGANRRQLTSYNMMMSIVRICAVIILSVRMIPIQISKKTAIYNERFRIRKLYSAYFNGSKYKSFSLVH